MSSQALVRLSAAVLKSSSSSTSGYGTARVAGYNPLHRPPESPLLTRHTCAQLYQNVTRGDALSREVAAGEEADETVVFKKLRHRINLETPPACVEGKPHNGIAIFNQQGADPMNDRVLLVKVKDTITDRIHVNAGLVALSSLYFRTLMYGAMRESRENEIQLTVDSAEEATALRAIIRAIYQPDATALPKDMEGLCTLVNVAERFGAEGIRDLALAVLLAKCRYGECDGIDVLRLLSPDLMAELVTDIGSLAYRKELSLLSPLEKGLFTGWWGDFWTPEPSSLDLMQRFVALPAPAVVALVKGEELCAASEDFVWMAASRWVHHHHTPPAPADEIPADVEAVLSGIRWAFLSGYLIENVVEKDPFVLASAELRALLEKRKAMSDGAEWQGPAALAERRRGHKQEDADLSFNFSVQVSIQRDQLAGMQAGGGILSTGVSYHGLPIRAHVVKTEAEKLAVALVHELLIVKDGEAMKVQREATTEARKLMQVHNLRVRVSGRSDRVISIEHPRYKAGFGYGKSNLVPNKTFEEILEQSSPYIDAHGSMVLSIDADIKVGSAGC